MRQRAFGRLESRVVLLAHLAAEACGGRDSVRGGERRAVALGGRQFDRARLLGDGMGIFCSLWGGCE
jgi:hypothetical protein